MKHIHILLAEDNEGDILLTSEALEEAKIVKKISIVKDGKAAIDFLEKRNGYSLEAPPDLILLDVNLPKKNGHEVLKYIKASPNLKKIPVIILTTSSSEKDIMLSYDNYASCFITKPVDGENFLNMVSTIQNIWESLESLTEKQHN